MSGDLQTRKRRGKAKKKAHLEALQREEYEQERLVLNTLAYEAEDEILNGKTKPVVNNSHKSSGGGGGGGGSSNGSGLVAKIIFLILLVSLSIVIGLILIELRGKQAGMETASVVPKAEVQPEPEIPTPSLHVEEPGPEPPSVSEPEIEDDFEPLEATPPLEEYIRVVEKEEEPVEEEVVEVVEDIPVEIVEEVVEEAVAPLEDSEAVEEVETEEEAAPVEIEEPAPVEEAEEPAPVEETVSEEVESPAAVEEVEEPAAVEDVEEQAVPEEVEEPAAIEEVEELPPVEVEEPVAVEAEVHAIEELEEPAVAVEEIEEPVVTEEKPAAEEEVVEEPAVAEALVEEPAATEEVVEAPADVVEVEEPAPVEEVDEPVAELEEPVVEVEEPVAEVEEPVVEEVEEPAGVPEVAAPVEESPAVPVEEEPVQVEEVAEEPVISETVEEVQAPLEVKEEIEEEEDPEDDEDKDDEEIDEPKIVLPPPEEDDDEDWSQYGREGGAEDLAQAYLRVESLAEEVLRLDPENSMVNHVAPHLSGVLKAMEEGHTEGILDTLNHIQIILEDVKNRIGDGDSETPIEGTADAKSMYGKADITSNVDYEIREELDAAEKVISKNLREALTTFGSILQNNPKSARALYGRALCLDRLAEEERSNSKLEQAIVTYRGVIDLADEDPSLVPLPLLRLAAEKCLDRMRFRGFFGKAVRVQQRLLQRFPDDLALRNQMGVTYLLMHQPSAAKEVFEAILEKWPEDGFAQVHYGFILKTTDQNNTGGAEYMKKGIESKAEGTQDGRFFLHLGDALQREGQTEEAYKVYDDAVAKGLFLNKYQRSLYNVDRLSSQPIWTVEQTTYTEFFRKLEANWEAIRDEAVALLTEPPQDGFRPESENLQERGDWKQYEMFSRGRKITANCVKAKVTCSLIDDFSPAAGCKRGQVKFSVMDPNTHVHAHTGPTNCRLRAHLGLVVPSGVHMRVADQMIGWEEGKIIIFDDSWEHEVWHNGTTKRMVLIVDVWHPELTDHERKSLTPL
ncbi:aspartyl/asparaginyl beta-hydroxylase-like isoform X5 [Macrobrachium nipponense]|uniref:aspartyl/asparaginyl beta-hydroxylase-like isoform X5 n=1 Tax=Macrobrachium nipponense TaxID=159736 RepID=UPI0030C7A9AC